MHYSQELVFPSVGESNYRIPSITTTNEGTVLALCNDRRATVDDAAPESHLVLRRKPLNGDWEAEQRLVAIPGWACSIGSAVYDRETGTAFCSLDRNPVQRREFGYVSDEEKAHLAEETRKRAAEADVVAGLAWLRSEDDGLTWTNQPYNCTPVTITNVDGAVVSDTPWCHGASAGIQLRHGEHTGRLLCAARFRSGMTQGWGDLLKYSYNSTIYSDDHGKTWHAGQPVQVGTGEGTLMERGDGTIYYNSRAYFKDGRRYLAMSHDGGETFGEFTADDFLQEESGIGCNASLLRVERSEMKDAHLLPEGVQSLTVFINPRAETRRMLSACVSFDEGKTWRCTRVIREGRSAYSSLAYCPASGRFHLLFEGGEKDPYDNGITAAEFDLEWLLN